MTAVRLNKIVLLLVVLFISAVFLSMIRQFLMVILLAGIFSALFQPVYKRCVVFFKGRRNLASAITLLLIFLVVFLPLAGLFGIVAAQAVKVGHSVTPWIQQNLQGTTTIDKLFESLPFYDILQQYKTTILEKAGELVSRLSSVFVNSLSTVTLSTVNLIFLLFLFLYTMFFFLKEGDYLLEKILYYVPLQDQDERQILEKFTSVTRATIKGTLIIGLLQGGLAGIAFWIVGIDSALFWGTIMVVLSVIPVVGSSLIWIPAVIILAASGAYIKAIGLAVFCGLLVGSLDNVLRPILVGKDTKMHELFILFGTIGGISMFGIIGFIVGPIIAALFVTVWAIYGETFKEYLPVVAKLEIGNEAKVEAAHSDSNGESKKDAAD
ncbi:AI-2E family transporter [candidate division KSB1 bacterium]|nr:AI-2E family transporter [candidate division KSB1 bacterium]RQW01028.1 MAG: AI-2E family transporter [candidate division KSB1 bacterium]